MDTPDGQDWFLHFQDVGNAGRIVHLQPMRWVDDWPIIGINEDENGCGEPVLRYEKPAVGATYPVDAPEDSDFFEGEKLGLQWQWNANYQEDWYALKEGQLILYAQSVPEKTSLCDVPNLLLQKWPAPEFQITICLHLQDMQEGDVAGMVSQCGHYTGLVVKKEKDKLVLQQRTGTWTEELANRQEDSCKVLREVHTNTIYMKMLVKEENFVSFEISEDGECYEKVGEVVEATPGRWVGVKVGLMSIHEAEGKGGSLHADYFVYENL